MRISMVMINDAIRGARNELKHLKTERKFRIGADLSTTSVDQKITNVTRRLSQYGVMKENI